MKRRRYVWPSDGHAVQALFDQLERSWFETKWRARTRDGDRFEQKAKRTARGLRLWIHWARKAGTMKKSTTTKWKLDSGITVRLEEGEGGISLEHATMSGGPIELHATHARELQEAIDAAFEWDPPKTVARTVDRIADWLQAVANEGGEGNPVAVSDLLRRLREIDPFGPHGFDTEEKVRKHLACAGFLESPGDEVAQGLATELLRQRMMTDTLLGMLAGAEATRAFEMPPGLRAAYLGLRADRELRK